jgi:CheY-like chemotaxis protein
MRILIAEDEEDIALSYREVLESRGHEVTLTSNGRECLEEFRTKSQNATIHPFDVILLDYRMPEMNGFEAAQQILKLSDDQRIIFASAYSRETLENLIRNDGMLVELLQKPFGRQELLNAVEDTLVYSKLQKLKVDIGDVKEWNPTHEQLSDLLDALMRLRDPNSIFDRIAASNKVSEYAATPSRNGIPGRNDDTGIPIIVDDALKFLGHDSISVFYFHLAKLGVQRQEIAQNHEQFIEALETMFGSASQMVRMRLIKKLEEKNSIEPSILNFARSLKQVKAFPKNRGRQSE